jgi:hypothetical protein
LIDAVLSGEALVREKPERCYHDVMPATQTFALAKPPMLTLGESGGAGLRRSLQGGTEMAVGTSLILIAFGAILAMAVNYNVSGIEIQTIGGILVVVGIIGLLFSLLFMASFSPFGGDRRGHDHY